MSKLHFVTHVPAYQSHSSFGTHVALLKIWLQAALQTWFLTSHWQSTESALQLVALLWRKRHNSLQLPEASLNVHIPGSAAQSALEPMREHASLQVEIAGSHMQLVLCTQAAWL